MKGAIRVFLFHQYPIIMEGLKRILSNEPRCAVVGEAATLREATSRLAKVKPEVVIVGAESSHKEDLETIRSLRQSNPDARILVMARSEDLDLFLSAFKLGANGYLLKESGIIEIVRSIQQVGNGMGYIPPSMIEPLVRRTLRNNPIDNGVQLNLTTREQEVFKLIAEGTDTNRIAGKLFISSKTVLSHRSRIMKKLNLGNNAQLIKLALAKGIISLGSASIGFLSWIMLHPAKTMAALTGVLSFG